MKWLMHKFSIECGIGCMTVTASTDSVDQIGAPLFGVSANPKLLREQTRIKAGKHLRVPQEHRYQTANAMFHGILPAGGSVPRHRETADPSV